MQENRFSRRAVLCRMIGLLMVFMLAAGSLPAVSAAEAGEEIRISVSYPSTLHKDAMIDDTIVFSDAWFSGNPEERNDRLGLVSAQMTALSGDGEKAAEVLRQLGFADAEAKRYDSELTWDCGYVIGSKTITRNGKAATLNAVVFKGLKYGIKGWLQNVTVNTEQVRQGDHASFAEAARYFMEDLAEMNREGEQVFWLCGLSRAGAIANTVSARLLEQEVPPAVFCCTFEAPTDTDREEAHDARYLGIHNYYCTDDVVPRIPLWGMVRYGQDISLDEVSLEAVQKMLTEQDPETEEEVMKVTDSFREEVSSVLDRLCLRIGALIENREDYSRIRMVDVPGNIAFDYTWQEGFQTLSQLVFGNNQDLVEHFEKTQKEKTDDSETPMNMLRTRRATLKLIAGRSEDFRNVERLTMASLGNQMLKAYLDQPVLTEDLFAILGILDAMLLPAPGEEMGEEELPDPIDVFEKYGSSLLFSHHPEVVIARMKILANTP